MPIYEYTCKKCDSQFEKLIKNISTNESIACPKCGSKQTARALSVFAVGSETPKSSTPAPGMCNRCGGPGPCGMN